MIKSEKKRKELALLLEKNNYTLISEAISVLRNDQPFEGAIGLLVAFYNKTEDPDLKKTIKEFMNDLKDPSVCIEVMDEIKKQLKDDTISMLVSSCWQSGLNYSEYSLDLADIYLKGDYLTAIECLTVIEESINYLSSGRRDEIIKLIKESPLSFTNEKEALNRELLAILEK